MTTEPLSFASLDRWPGTVAEYLDTMFDPPPFHLLPTVARELPSSCEILLDTGIMSGADIVAAVALGARSTLVGRAYLYGLMASGEAASSMPSKFCRRRSAARCGCSG